MNMPGTGSIARPRSGTAATWLSSIPPVPVRSLAASAIGKRTTPDFTATPRCVANLTGTFKERHFAWGPYLFGELGRPELKAEERRLIADGRIQATRFRYVGERL